MVKRKVREPESDGVAKERVLETAEKLFSEHGYAAVTLRDIADALGIRQSSLYYHAPEGKKQLFVEAMKHTFERHRLGLEESIRKAKPDVRSQLRAAAGWMLSQPPVNFDRMFSTDMNAVSKTHVRELGEAMETAMFRPLEKIFIDALKRGEIQKRDTEMITGTVITIFQSLHHSERYTAKSQASITEEVIDMLLNGLYRR